MSDVIYDLQATHTRLGPVFVIGYPRSGTSMTCRLLRRYLKVSFGTESQFILRYERRLKRYGDLNDDRNVRRLIRDIGAERFFARSQRNWGFVLDPEQAFRTVRARTYSAVLNAIFSQLAEHNGMVRWGDKTPAYNHDLDVIRQLFPDAQFVHVVRDGRDVALSIRTESFGPKNACQTAFEWKRALRSIETFSQRVPRDQFFVIRYEELTRRTCDVISSLADFLGINDDGGRLRAYVRAHVGAEIKNNNSDKWRLALAPRDVERFEGVAGHTLRRYGYDLALHGRARPVSPSQQVYWKVRGRTDQWLMGSYWADNWYKLALRARAVVQRM